MADELIVDFARLLDAEEMVASIARYRLGGKTAQGAKVAALCDLLDIPVPRECWEQGTEA